MTEINYQEEKWNFETRVKRLVDKGHNRGDAEEIVKIVIQTKEVIQDLIETVKKEIVPSVRCTDETSSMESNR